MKTILIVDDHPAVLEGLAGVLRAEGYGVLTALTSAEALKTVTSGSHVDMMVIDISLSGSHDGLDLIARLREHTAAPVIIYTMHGEMWNVSALMQSGARGIVLKGDSIDELIMAVKTVGEGRRYISQSFAGRIDALNNNRGILSAKDIEVLRMISDGVSTKDIAGRMCLTDKAVEYHRTNIIKKLGSNNMTQAINQAVRLGILSIIAAAAVMPVRMAASNPEAVDLGLSVKWADRNLGAPSPLEAGGFYAFGETEEKAYYDWDTYTHCTDGDMFAQHNIGEESICGTQYDAAHVLLGGGWRMPTAEEMEELITTCSMEYIEAEPLNFLRLTAPGASYIDIPVTGYMSLGRVVRENLDVTLWTGSFYVEAGEEDGFEYYMNGPFFLAGAYPDYPPFVDEGTPSLGIQIRPVFDGGTSGVTAPAIGDDSCRPMEIYTIDGRRLPAGASLSPGVYIKKQGTTAKKITVQ